MRFLLRPLLLTSTLLGSVLGAAPAAQAAITYIGEAAIAGNLTDLSNLNFNLEDGLPANRLGAFGSGIAYNPITGT